MGTEEIEKRLDKIEFQLAEINEVFHAIQGGLKVIEFLGRVAKALLPFILFCGIAWGAIEQFIKGK